MSRRKVIAGNWKMHNNIEETIKLINDLKQKLASEELNCDVIVCPAFTSLQEAVLITEGTKIKVGAQNMYFEDKGAFTGEVSADMLLSVGCEYVIIGHSERRTIFGETNELLNKKLKQAIAKGLKPIFCIGETLEERESSATNDILKKQIIEGLKDISEEELKDVIIAYEPVWAIGTGKTATPEQAEETHNFIRYIIHDLYGAKASDAIVIQYGGSVKPENAKALLSQKDIDGALVGGACLKADSFIGIIKNC